MPQGLQVRDSTGLLTLDLTDRITRILGSQTIASGSTGTITHAAFATGNIWCMVRSVNNGTFNGYTPEIVLNETLHRIEYSPRVMQVAATGPATVPDVVILYGVY